MLIWDLGGAARHSTAQGGKIPRVGPASDTNKSITMLIGQLFPRTNLAMDVVIFLTIDSLVLLFLKFNQCSLAALKFIVSCQTVDVDDS